MEKLYFKKINKSELCITRDDGVELYLGAAMYSAQTTLGGNMVNIYSIITGKLQPAYCRVYTDLIINDIVPKSSSEAVSILNTFIGNFYRVDAGGDLLDTYNPPNPITPISAKYDKQNAKLIITFGKLNKRPFFIHFDALMVENGVNRVMNIEHTCPLVNGASSGTFWVTQEKHNAVINASVTGHSKELVYIYHDETKSEIHINNISVDISEIEPIRCFIVEYNI